MKLFADQIEIACHVRKRRSLSFDDFAIKAQTYADNVTTNAGSGGSTFATDDIGGVHYPFSKLAWGPRDTANEVDRASGKAMPVQGEAAHDAATTGAPVLIGAEARASDGTAVASGDVTRIQADTLGKVVVLPGATHDMHTTGTTNYTNNTGADVIVAAGAGVRIAVTNILVTNAHASVSTKVSIRDGTTAKITGYALAAGGGFSLSAGGRPLFITTANTAVTAICATTGADVDVSVSGYKIAN